MEPICRDYVKGICKRGKRCRFRHPIPINNEARKRASRQIGCCFCGAPQTCFVKKSFRFEGDDSPMFYVVCSRTKRSMRLCMNARTR